MAALTNAVDGPGPAGDPTPSANRSRHPSGSSEQSLTNAVRALKQIQPRAPLLDGEAGGTFDGGFKSPLPPNSFSGGMFDAVCFLFNFRNV